MLQLTYFGILRAPTTWAKVCRELLSSLSAMNCDLNIFEQTGEGYDKKISLPPAVTERITNKFRENDVIFTFGHPSTYPTLEGKFKIGILSNVSTVVPPAWIDAANTHLDLLFVSSSFCKDAFIQSGMDETRIEILPYGYDPAIYSPKGPKMDLAKVTKKNFTFLTVSSPHKRKGLETLMQAYRNAFTKEDDVCLIIKLSYLPNKKEKSFEYRNVNMMFDDFRKDKTAPEIVLLNTFYEESEIANLYRSASCLVSATRGEGFGLVYLEALACGLPVIVTGWSGHMDFLNHKNATLVDYRLRTAGEIQYDCTSKEAKIAEPDVHDFSKKLFLAMKSPKNIKYAPADTRYQWKNLAEQFLLTIEKRLAAAEN